MKDLSLEQHRENASHRFNIPLDRVTDDHVRVVRARHRMAQFGASPSMVNARYPLRVGMDTPLPVRRIKVRDCVVARQDGSIMWAGTVRGYEEHEILGTCVKVQMEGHTHSSLFQESAFAKAAAGLWWVEL